jgi:membrane protein DedA with SNARE-associated domain/membrane-associated phospholipid phosphatase
MAGIDIDSSIAWISAHPVAAGGLVFLIAFGDALAVVGMVVPALPLLFAIGVLVGTGHIDGTYALASAALGAFAGDGLSYWVGHRWGHRLRDHWPFRRYPQWLDRGEGLFRRHGAGAIVIARYVGPVRPFVPAVAGMLRVRLRRYLPASAFAALTWAAAYLAPGWVLGASYAAVAAVADRLLLALVALLAVLALVWATVLYTSRWFAHHADALLARALRWSRAHPRLGRYAVALIDPNRPESAALVVLAACLLAIGWAWFAWSATLLVGGGPLPLDRAVFDAMVALRNPLADRLMAALSSIGDVQVLLPASLLVLLWLTWRRRWMAAAHWLAALAFGLVLTRGLGAVVTMPRPVDAAVGFGFPSVAVTMTTIVFGFFAVLIARELPGRRRIWPYLVAGVAVTLLGFARLYLDAHWLSDIVGGVLFGLAWLLLLGIAYRRHMVRSLWMRPLATVFYGTFVVAACWHAPRAIDPTRARFAPPPPHLTLAADGWWEGDWASLPLQRNERDVDNRWPLDVQVAGSLAPLRQRLQARGWQVQPQAGWVATLRLLDGDASPARLPVLPATLDAQAEVLLLRRPGPGADQLQVLRLGRAPARLDSGQPLWLGSSQGLRLTRPWSAFALWQPVADHVAAHAAVREALAGFEMRESGSTPTGTPVLRLRTPQR